MNALEGLIALELAVGVALATLVLTTFFRQVPGELEHPARIAGASSGQVLQHIILPLAGPGIAAVHRVSVGVRGPAAELYPGLTVGASCDQAGPKAEFYGRLMAA